MIYYIYFESIEHEFVTELNAHTEASAIRETQDWFENHAMKDSIDTIFVMESAAGDIDDVDVYKDRVCKEYYRIKED